jgi:hypothetical protein
MSATKREFIAVDPDTFDVIRRLAFERRVSNGRIVADAMAAYIEDPRSAAERAADEHAAQVRDTEASDRPC